jgi:uncharacterized membrane protein
MYYAMSLSQSEINSPGLQHVFFEAFAVADGYRTAIMEKAGYEWSDENQTYWKQINNDWNNHPDEPIHAGTPQGYTYQQVWHSTDYDGHGHYDTNYVYNYHEDDNVAYNPIDAVRNHM